MNSRISALKPYPFERLAELLEGVEPSKGKTPIRWSIGEPSHPAPELVKDVLKSSLDGLSIYPATLGARHLREAICDWLETRFNLPVSALDPDKNILPVAGTREALFSLTQAILDPTPDTVTIIPNPFYQIYEGATLLAGAKPYFTNLMKENDFVPDFQSIPESIWKQCQLLYVCSPGNPTGACMDRTAWLELISIAEKYQFVIVSDECYSELYFDEDSPPVGLLDAAYNSGKTSFERCLVVHSLSKRSNLPGMRSGFVAGDARLLEKYLRYRTYHGCTLPPPVQDASTAAWRDEEHVKANRVAYREKFDQVVEILSGTLPATRPQGSFYLWPELPIEEQEFTRKLYAEENLLILPGSYLSRPTDKGDPGERRARMALVAPLDECIEGATRLRDFVQRL